MLDGGFLVMAVAPQRHAKIAGNVFKRLPKTEPERTTNILSQFLLFKLDSKCFSNEFRHQRYQTCAQHCSNSFGDHVKMVNSVSIAPARADRRFDPSGNHTKHTGNATCEASR